MFAVLLGGHEVGAGGVANVGDRNAWGGATVMIRGDNTVCWAIVLSNLDTPTAAHIHMGRAGTNGPIRLILEPPVNEDGDQFGPGASSGCITSGAGQPDNYLHTLNQIEANPALHDISVRSVAFPNGGVRGQLH